MRHAFTRCTPGTDATTAANCDGTGCPPWPPQEAAMELCFPAETVILALGQRADRFLADALANRVEVDSIRDCV